MKRKILLTVIATTMVFGSAITANAAQEDVFDAEYYAETYPDVVAVFGDDENVLLQHYLNYGIAEGRSASAYYNALAYKTANADLAAAFGDDWDAYADHWLSYGIAEGRYAGGAVVETTADTSVSESSETVSTSNPYNHTDWSTVVDTGETFDDRKAAGEIIDMTEMYGIVIGDGKLREGSDISIYQNWDLKY